MKKIKFFLDSCDPEETEKAISLLGSIDGQTTNPTLLVKNPEIQKFVSQGKKLREVDLLSLYKEAIHEIGRLTNGAISVEVYADWNTKAEVMLRQAHDMMTWGSNIYMKFPTIPEGLKAAYQHVTHNGRANMTLVFDQDQAAAVYSATFETEGTAFVSPFVGRWDDRGMYGLDIVKNIRSMYDSFDATNRRSSCHVEILAASIRSVEHMYGAMTLGADIITAPLQTYQAWVDMGSKFPKIAPSKPKDLKHIPYRKLLYNSDYHIFHIDQSENGLLNQGLTRFANDWSSVVER